MNAFELLQDVTSLGGTARLRSERERYNRLCKIHQSLCSEAAELDERRMAIATRFREKLFSSEQLLRNAHRMLNPILGTTRPSPASRLSFSGRSLFQRRSASDGLHEFAEAKAFAVGVAASAAATAGLWGGIQVFGTASTGAAMAGLHGAAASSAGFAWLGGGSLAAGGGGMAAGHLVLPVIGSVVLVALTSISAHCDAFEAASECDTLEEANRKNTATLKKISEEAEETQRYELLIDSELRLLARAVWEAQQSLFRFGCLSRLFRRVRYWLKGYYYKVEEFHIVEQLASAVDAFLARCSEGPAKIYQ